ncbi:MAG: UTP--glucose-1-phosphate uridylyltransferase [SAR324 cluster bacterium]|nr:UTP--glucose-1-phosphate uridylyltransferase [SAR324 cluster bacterium]
MKGIILAAGYATRFLPASKTIPKEMFPLIDTPVIDFIVQEMVDSGIKDILLVSSRRKKSLEDYFDREVELATSFAQSNEFRKLERIKPIEANIFTLRQQYMMGTGNALMLVEPFVAGEPFVVAYPDDVVFDDPPLSKQLIDAYQKTGDTILAVQEVPREDVSRYGVIDPEEGEEGLIKVRQMVEKPMPGTEPSRYVSYGRYLYTNEIFDVLRKTAYSHSQKGEFTQTEAINYLARKGKVSAVRFAGTRYDVGEPLGYVQTSVQLALQRPEYREPLLLFLQELLKKEAK